MAAPAISVIIVSNKRPRDLERAIASLAYQSVQNIEVIVVAERPPLVASCLEAPLRYIEFTEANISRARNLGIQEAKAPLVAFCDDDAVPDPSWLERLVEPFYDNSDIASTGGFVRGRNGFSYQWKAVGFYPNGADFSLDIDENKRWTVFEPRSDRFVKTIGTNCAFRKDRLYKIGGFDEGLHYYLDDTDVNLRLQKAGFHTAIVPNAQVIHNYARSRGRKDNRVPQSLYNLGASTNLFLRKYCPEKLEENIEKFSLDQTNRLKNYFHLGLITSRQKKRLLRDLNNGLVSGSVRESQTPLRPIRAQKLRKLEICRFEFSLKSGHPYNVTKVSEYPVFYKVYYSNHAARLGFDGAGYWMVTGGRFGRILRQGPIWRYRSPRKYRNDLTRTISPYFKLSQ